MASIHNSGSGIANSNFAGQQSNYTQSGNHNILNIYQQEADHSAVVKWLSPPDSSSDHATARYRHQKGTCEWMLQDGRYKRWKAGDTRHLWLHGKPGCGKTVLCSTVIEDLQVDATLVYFYFTFSDDSKQSYEPMLRSLVCQLGSREPARSVLRQAMSYGQPAMHKLEDIFIAVTTAMEVIIVLDALDEIPELSGTRRDLLARLRTLLSKANARLFATARYISDIADWMADLQCAEISPSPLNIRADIQRFAEAQLCSDPNLRRHTPTVKAMIKQNVTDNADGMFRWAFLLLEQMAGVRMTGFKTIQAALNSFPKHLDDVYSRIFRDLEEYHEVVLTLLRWIVYAQRPMTLGELVDTLVIDAETDVVQFEDRCEPENITRLLTSLVVIVNGDSEEAALGSRKSVGQVMTATTKIRLAHFTVQEYLESSRVLESDAVHFHLSGKVGHRFITQSCLTYLMHYGRSSKTSTEQDLTAFPLLHYAAESWYHHLLLHEHEPEVEIKLLMSDKVMKDWLAVHSPDMSWRRPFEAGGRQSGTNLYYASYLGLETAVRLLLKTSADVNAQGGRCGNALQAASEGGHTEIVRLLVENKADVNAKGGYYGNALQAASEGGHTEIVKLLVENGANVNAQGDGLYGNALQAASAKGHTEILKLLLDKGADVSEGDSKNGSALHAASANGRVESVALLLASGAIIDTEGGSYCSALYAASRRDCIPVMKLLLEHDVNVKVVQRGHGNVLHIASSNPGIGVIKLLLYDHANLDAVDAWKYGESIHSVPKTPLQLQDYQLKLMLLEQQHKRRLEDQKYMDFHYHGEHLSAVKLLIKNGYNVNANEGESGGALQMASGGGNTELVRLLLENGANVNARGGRYGSALLAAMAGGHIEVVKLLLAKGANVDTEASCYSKAFKAAPASLHLELLKLLKAGKSKRKRAASKGSQTKADST